MMLRRLDLALSTIERIFSLCAVTALFAIMSIVASDVALRYIFNRPWGWSYDFISLYVIVGLFFLSLSRTFAVHGHISVDLLHHYLGATARRSCEAVICFLSAGLFATITYASAVRAWEHFVANDVLSGSVAWPAWPSAALVPLGAGLMTLRLALTMICQVYTLATGRIVIALPPVAGSAEAIKEGAFE